ncbi:hypothetical protein Poli38472_008061 [Pythium oligandrum]|uniref:Apple domain-containing protein n=1 Tax=Pythium oligandrum TaxID=41045 RepID=A0A8K1CLU1_PYTOL|nr:hypothetical protein Poli38472_008061 [Pythium oligandrum]|eukprot:TMW65419.1 hypothetical protein Poli38472_008061 [Pythium oligandrum]
MRLPRFLTASSVLLLAVFASQAHAIDTYDVVVVGSGPGGLIAAEYLSRDPLVKVLVLEAGLPSVQASGGTDVPSYAQSKGFTKFDIPGEYDAAASVFDSSNAKYTTDYLDDRKLPLGQLVGGCSTINAALYFRVPDSYISQTQWPFSADHVNQLYDAMENEVYGTTDNPSPDGKAYVQEAYNIVSRALQNHGGYQSKSLNEAEARNNKDRTYGHAPFAIKNGLRDSPAKTCWGKMKSRPNVKLLTSARVSYIKHTHGQATGVVYNDNIEVAVSAHGSVIMAAGALGTPKVLIQSGIGPRDQLSALQALSNRFPGVKQTFGNNGDGWVLNENIGKSLFDTTLVLASFSHPEMRSFQYRNKPQDAINQYMRDQTGPLSTSGPVLIGYENYEVQNRMYEFQITVLTNGFGDSYTNPNGFTTSLYINNPESRDMCSFDSSGRYRGFTYNSLYMATNRDLAAIQNYTAKVVDMLQKEGASFVSKSSSQLLNDWVNGNRNYVTHHFGGTCYVSQDSSDTSRCADDKLRVVGTSNIYIGDASAMRDGTVNPYGFIMYTGREVGQLVQSSLLTGPLAPTPLPPATGATQCGAMEPNVDIIGNDLSSALAPRAEDCCSICQSTIGCGAFTWSNYNGGTCWLKSSKGQTTTTSGVVSSVMVSSQCSKIDENTDYSSTDVGQAGSSTAEGCCKICKARPGCGAFSWTDYEGGTCWLKSDRGAAVPKTGARSAVVV